jgi:MYXO-CTERM domain-containing protein
VETPNAVHTWDEPTRDDCRAVDVQRTDNGHVLYYTRRDMPQTPVKRRIGVAWTTPTNDWSSAIFYDNLCPVPEIDDPEGTDIPEGTEAPEDTGDTSDPIPVDPCEADPESDECEEEASCGCQSSPSPMSGFALGVALFGLLRTRRRRG